MALVGCGELQNGELVLVAHEDSRDYMHGLWKDYCGMRLLSRGVVLLSSQDRSSLTICGQKGKFCTCYCLPCARRQGIIW
jgi:hypothetical protein